MAELVDATDLTNIVDILILLKFVPDSLNRINQRIEEFSTSLKQSSKCFLNRNLKSVQVPVQELKNETHHCFESKIELKID